MDCPKHPKSGLEDPEDHVAPASAGNVEFQRQEAFLPEKEGGVTEKVEAARRFCSTSIVDARLVADLVRGIALSDAGLLKIF